MYPTDLRTARKALGLDAAQELLERHGFKVVPPKLESITDRFWVKVRKTDTCWLWEAAKDRKGYGLFKMNGRTVGAHRASWTISNGWAQIPFDHAVMHSCDNPGCVRPDHLIVGSSAENMADKVSKGRQASGLRTVSGVAKLSPDKVRAIRASNERTGILADTFGVSGAAIRFVRAGATWGHVE